MIILFVLILFSSNTFAFSRIIVVPKNYFYSIYYDLEDAVILKLGEYDFEVARLFIKSYKFKEVIFISDELFEIYYDKIDDIVGYSKVIFEINCLTNFQRIKYRPGITIVYNYYDIKEFIDNHFVFPRITLLIGPKMSLTNKCIYTQIRNQVSTYPFKNEKVVSNSHELVSYISDSAQNILIFVLPTEEFFRGIRHPSELSSLIAKFKDYNSTIVFPDINFCKQSMEISCLSGKRIDKIRKIIDDFAPYSTNIIINKKVVQNSQLHERYLK